jgi:hypothetical protein
MYRVKKRGTENKGLNDRIVKQWQAGRYKSYSAPARVFRVYPKMVERAIKYYENHNNKDS